MATDATETMPTPRIARTTMEWETIVSEAVGPEAIEKIRNAKTIAERKEALFKGVIEANPQWNGEAKPFARRLEMNREQLDAKEKWYTTVVKAPFRTGKWVFEKTFVEHPYLSTAATLALLYYTGGGSMMLTKLMQWIAVLPDGGLKAYLMEQIPSLSGAPGAISGGANAAANLPADLL